MSRETSIVCYECGHNFTSDEIYNTDWGYADQEGTDHTKCPACGEVLVVKHFFVKHFEVLGQDDPEREEYMETASI